MTQPPELLAIGELLMDVISTDYAETFRTAEHYQRFPGGSPANLAMNCARLGRRVALAATVGNDDAGELLIEYVAQAGVDTSMIERHEMDPTTLILVTKSRTNPDFVAYRCADRQINHEQLAGDYVAQAKLIHTTAFALSKEPARTAITTALKRCAAAGGTVSMDYNYADKIWDGDRAAGLAVLEEVGRLGPLIKVSDVDYERLFGEPVAEPSKAAQRLIDMGTRLVCLTLGGEGSYVLGDGANFHLPVNPIEVVDSTGAGDAFWSGFLSAYLADYSWQDCAYAGRGMAEKKLTTLGPILESVDLGSLITP